MQVASLYCLYTSSITMAAFVKVAGVVQNTQWAATCFTLASLSVLSTVLLYFAADWRSKKMMLSSQLALLVVYAMGTFVVALMVMQPTKIDTRVRATVHVCGMGCGCLITYLLLGPRGKHSAMGHVAKDL